MGFRSFLIFLYYKLLCSKDPSMGVCMHVFAHYISKTTMALLVWKMDALEILTDFAK